MELPSSSVITFPHHFYTPALRVAFSDQKFDSFHWWRFSHQKMHSAWTGSLRTGLDGGHLREVTTLHGKTGRECTVEDLAKGIKEFRLFTIAYSIS